MLNYFKVEELSVSICENKPLADENERIKQENQELKELLSQQQVSHLLIPNMLEV